MGMTEQRSVTPGHAPPRQPPAHSPPTNRRYRLLSDDVTRGTHK